MILLAIRKRSVRTAYSPNYREASLIFLIVSESSRYFKQLFFYMFKQNTTQFHQKNPQ